MIERAEATKEVVKKLEKEVMMLASLGNTKYDLKGAEDRDLNFYMWNSMGMASSMALGMALAQPQRKMVLFQGDGDLLMNLNSLATIGWCSPKNLLHIVWDNQSYQITGGQPTASSDKTNFAQVALGCGYVKAETVETLDAFKASLRRALNEDGPWMLHAICTNTRAAAENRPPTSPTFIKHRFMAAMGAQH